MDTIGISYGPIEDVPHGSAVTAKDPGGIAVEFFSPQH